MKNSALLLPLFICLIISSCKNSTDPTASNSPSASGDLIPLKTDNKWIYRSTTTDTFGNILLSRLDTSNIGLSVGIQGIVWSFFSAPGNFSADGVVFLANRIGGVWGFNEKSMQPFILFPYPAISGSEYVSSSDSSAARVDGPIFQFIVKFISTSENVASISQSFVCYHYQFITRLISQQTGEITNELGSELFIAPGIGIVKEIDRTSGIKTILLQDYMLR